MSLVNFVKLSTNQYSSLRDKDENTFYLVNDSGDFSYDTFEDNAKLYLGEKQIIPNKATTTSDGLMSKEDKAKLDNLEQAAKGDDTISPFAGFLPDGATIIDGSSNSTNGEVLYDSATNRFIWKDLSGTFVKYYTNWSTSYLYNTTSDSSASAKEGKIFSYNDKHYTVIDGELQDMSVLLSAQQIGNLISLAEIRSKGYTDGVAIGTRNYVDSKIQLVSTIPDTPVDGVLYCIPETSLSKPTEE